MGWGNKAIEIRSAETGHLDGVFMHKKAQKLKFLCERNDKVRCILSFYVILKSIYIYISLISFTASLWQYCDICWCYTRHYNFFQTSNMKLIMCSSFLLPSIAHKISEYQKTIYISVPNNFCFVICLYTTCQWGK